MTNKLRVEVGEPIAWLLGVALLAGTVVAACVAWPFWQLQKVLTGNAGESQASRQSRPWRRQGGNGYAPRRLHPDGSCAGEAE